MLRLGTIPEGFEADRAAMAFSGPDLPVPKARTTPRQAAPSGGRDNDLWLPLYVSRR